MKFVPMPSTSPKLLASATVSTATDGYEIKLEAIADPRSGQSYLAIGIGTPVRKTRAWLTASQLNDLLRQAEQLTTIL